MADYQYLDQTGVIVPDTSDILTGVQSEYKSVFGQDLNVSSTTPQGVLINGETIARSEVVRNNAAVANQINPNIAGGVFLDAICALTGLQRTPATHSVIPGATVTGVAGAIIPGGSQARTASGDLFQTVGAVTLGVAGTATVDFESIEFGPIPATVGALSQIVTPVLGWETVTNATDAILGLTEQSDSSLRALRKNTLALQGIGLPEAIISLLYDVPNVKSLQFRENITSSIATIDGITLSPHSIWACVDGATDTEVAEALLTGKSMGADWNGATVVNVIEQFSGQTYPVAFDRPTDVPIIAKATVRIGTSVVNPVLAVQQAITDYAAGLLDGLPGFVVGGSVSPFELAAAVNQEIIGSYVQKMEVATVASGVYQTTEIPLALDEQATILIGGITVVLI